MLKLVPFHDSWVTNYKLDLKAIYRRPQRATNEFDEVVQAEGPDGLPLWDVTTPLRVLDHNKHLAKGFEYVTLASRDDLMKAAKAGTVADWRQYDQHQTGGPWNAKMYAKGQQTADLADLELLKADVSKFGVEAVEAIRRRTDPAFRVPEALKPGAKKPKAEAVA